MKIERENKMKLKEIMLIKLGKLILKLGWILICIKFLL